MECRECGSDKFAEDGEWTYCRVCGVVIEDERTFLYA